MECPCLSHLQKGACAMAVRSSVSQKLGKPGIPITQAWLQAYFKIASKPAHRRKSLPGAQVPSKLGRRCAMGLVQALAAAMDCSTCCHPNEHQPKSQDPRAAAGATCCHAGGGRAIEPAAQGHHRQHPPEDV
eukprot:1144499-Pelagomonas_calceolata.AAC.9